MDYKERLTHPNPLLTERENGNSYTVKFILLLTNLFKRYNLGEISGVSLEDYSEKIYFKLANKAYEFISDFSKIITLKNEGHVLTLPVMYWRNERKYIEMKNLLKEKQVHKPVGMKIKNISITDKIDNILIKELDIIEWILDDKIIAVYANGFKNRYFNIITSTKNNIKVSMEIGRVKNGSDISMHEIIAQKGVITDQPVDTQTSHYPVYVYTNNAAEIYNDIDFELYGLKYYDVARIRYVLNVFQNNVLQNIDKQHLIIERYNRLKLVVESIYRSGNENKKIFTEK